MLRRSLPVLLAGAAGLAVSAAPAGAADFTWTGAAPQPSWSLPANWGAAAPSDPVDTLRFPALTSPACASSPSAAACYVSTNNLAPGLGVGGIELDGGTPYELSGNAITLGAGGIAVSGAAAGEPAFPELGMPVALGAPQTWSMEAGAVDHELLVTGGVTADPSTGLTAQLGRGTYLVLLSEAEVGPVTATGDGSLALGFPPRQGRLNASNGRLVSLVDGASLLVLDGVSGPLATDGGAVQLGQFDRAGELAVNGTVTLDSAGALIAFVNSPGTEPGSDYSRLRATGDVNLAGAQLIPFGGVDPDTQACPQPTPDDVLTIVETTDGAVSGTFAGVPNGATVELTCIGASGTPPTARIDYTTTTVTATILTAGTPPEPTTTTLDASPSSAVTNQPVTLTATVSAESGTPAGTVRFERAGTQISDCAARELDDDGVATCQASFAAAGSPHQLTARFTPAPGGSLASSTSPASSVTVTPAATTAVVTFPVSTIGLNQPILLTATITPAHTGPARPQGLVDFRVDGVPLDGCTGVELTPQESSSITQCELTYFGGGTGSQTDQISVRYLGDASFSGSTSPDSPLTVVLSQPSPSPSPPVTAPAPPVSVGAIPPPPATTTGPVGRASTGRAQVRGTSVDVRLACAGARGRSCRITLKTTTVVVRRGGRVLSVRPAQSAARTTRRTLTVAPTRTVTLAAGSRRTIRYKLSAAGARLLAGRRQLAVTMLATQRTASGRSTNVSRQVLRFKAPAKAKRKR
ncbi:MAG: Ig-like domain-containing protein [Solirubrobacteraceae bacterium]|nr:Ig-like domain-containing protein [Solirubrobacteraceae bacterium]